MTPLATRTGEPRVETTSQAAPVPPNPPTTQAGASAPAPTSHSTSGGWANPATLADAIGRVVVGEPGAASAGHVTRTTAVKA